MGERATYESARNEVAADLRPEYDMGELLKGGVRGKYAERYHAGPNTVFLDSEVATAYRGEKAGSASDFWSDIQRALGRQTFRNWSVASGELKGSFHVVELFPDRIEVVSAGISGPPRKITRSDLEKVAALWPEYRQGNVPRVALRDVSKNSTYIITLLHWLDPA